MDEPKLTLPFLYKKNKGKKNAGRKSCGQEEEDQSKSSAWKRRSLPEGSSGAGACGSGGELGGDDEFSFGAYKNSRGKGKNYTNIIFYFESVEARALLFPILCFLKNDKKAQRFRFSFYKIFLYAK